LVSSAKLLDDAYRTEKNVDVRERLVLVRRVLVDNESMAFSPTWQTSVSLRTGRILGQKSSLDIKKYCRVEESV
jgi:hypothetical protein